MAFVCYLDDSDDTQSSVITLAGYCATVPGWEDYETRSRIVYDHPAHQIGDILHAKEFHSTKGPFKGWSSGKKSRFIDSLFFENHLTWGVAVSVDKAGFKKHKDDGHPGIGPNLSPFGMAFGAIMHTLLRGNPLAGAIQAEGLSFIVESGHRNNGDIDRYFHFAKNHDLYKGFLRTINFADKAYARALHLADMLAFHARRHHAMECAHPRLTIPHSRILSRMTSKMPHYMKLARMGEMRPEKPNAGDAVWWPVPLSSRPGRDNA